MKVNGVDLEALRKTIADGGYTPPAATVLILIDCVIRLQRIQENQEATLRDMGSDLLNILAARARGESHSAIIKSIDDLIARKLISPPPSGKGVH